MKIIVAFVTALFCIGVVSAQEGRQIIQAPTYTRGEEWMYLVIRKSALSISNIPTGEIVIQHDGKKFLMKDGDESLLHRLFDSVPTLYEDISPKKWLHFPLETGFQWKSEWESEVRRKGKSTTSVYTVVGWDSVTVGSNTFKAVRITREDVLDRGFQKFEYWYAPRVKAVVKANSENGAGTTYDVTLMSFRSLD